MATAIDLLTDDLPQPETEVASALKEDSKPVNENRLCGYLAKINSVGLIKGSKRRWFVFDKATCTLNYFRSHKDPKELPIGSIPIADCVFTCTAEGLLINSFNITQGTRTHGLQAVDQKSMLWWLQELQYERRVYNMQHVKTTSISQSTDDQSLIDLSTPAGNSGLLCNDKEKKLINHEEERRTYGDSLSLIPVLPRVEHPPETVGINSANLDVLKPGTNALTEIGNKMAQLGGGIVKLRPKPARPAPPSPSSVFYAKRYSQSEEEQMTITAALEQNKAHQKYKSQFEKKPIKVSHLIDKMQVAVKSGFNSSHSESEKQLSEFAETLALLKEEIELMKTSLDSKDETIELLKRELKNLEASSTPDTVSQFATTHQLRSELTALKLSLEHYRQESEETKIVLNQEKEKTKMFEEMMVVKDDVVMRLTNQIQELSKKEDKRNSRSLLFGGELLSSEDSETFKKLQEEVEAYRLQNKFLNNEILELTHLRKVDQERADLLHEKNLNQEAMRCQLHSKYFILLSEVDKMKHQEVVNYDEHNDEPLLKQESAAQPSIVQQLVQEAIRDGGRNDHLNALFRSSKYDRYGFIQIIDDDDESSFLAAASRLQQSASNIFNSIEQQDMTTESRWQRYIAEKGVQRNAEFKAMVRLGIPHNLRPKVWKTLVDIRTTELRQMLNADGSYYEKLCQQGGVAPLYAKQIDLDLLRTLPNNRFFSKIDSVGIKRLKRILCAYSLHNPSIGYCQGLNRVAAISLLYLPEEDAFWCLVAIVECIMPPDYYSSTLTASQADQRVFRDLLAEKMPLVHARLEAVGVDVSLITFNWFLCVFCDGVPPETMLRIWDVLLNESSKVLFRYALAFFKHIETDILELNDYMTVFNLLRKMVYKMYDARALSQLAFQEMNPLSMRKVNRLRVMHVEKVRAELCQLQKVRSEYANTRTKASVNSDLLSDDEGEDD